MPPEQSRYRKGSGRRQRWELAAGGGRRWVPVSREKQSYLNYGRPIYPSERGLIVTDLSNIASNCSIYIQVARLLATP